MIKKIRNIIKFPFLALICLYQKTFSPDHGYISRFFPSGYCRFYPTCSEYTYQAIDKYGIFRGGMKGFLRILRCNPWNPGGEDPLE
jgi:hypothetical protein